MIVNALQGRGKPPLLVLIYVLAKNFNCSPVDLMKLDKQDFDDFLEIMRVEQLINNRHEQ